MLIRSQGLRGGLSLKYWGDRDQGDQENLVYTGSHHYVINFLWAIIRDLVGHRFDGEWK